MGSEGSVGGIIRRRRRCDGEGIVAGGGRSSGRRGSAWFGAVCRVFGGGSPQGRVVVSRTIVWQRRKMMLARMRRIRKKDYVPSIRDPRPMGRVQRSDGQALRERM